MAPRLAWFVIAVTLTVPLASWWLPADVPLILKTLGAGLFVAAALHPLTGLMALALLGPSAVPLAVASGPPALSGTAVAEGLALIVLSGVAWRWSFLGAPPPGRLTGPALVLGAILTASGAAGLSVEQMTIAPLPVFASDLWVGLTTRHFVAPWEQPMLSQMAYWLTGLLLALVVERVVRQAPADGVRLSAAAACGIAGAAAYSLQRLLEIAGRAEAPWGAFVRHALSTRISPHFPDINAVGSFFAMGTAVWLVWLSAPRVSPAWRLASTAGAVTTGGALWLTQSRMAQLAALLVIILVWLRVRQPSLRARVVAGAAAAVVVLITVTNVTGVSRGSGSAAIAIRANLAKVGLQMLVAHPVFGVGLGEFQRQSTTYVSPGLISVFPAAAGGENAHNQFVQVAAELGAPGLAALVWLLWPAVVSRMRPTAVPGAVALWATAWRAGVGALLVSGLGGHPWLTPYVWMFSGLALGLAAGLTAAPLPAWRRHRAMTIGLLVLVAVGAGVQISRARARADLDARMVGASAVAGDLDGVPYRIAAEVSTWYVRTSARIVEIPLRAEHTGTCEVSVTIDRTPANVVLVTGDRWQPVRFTFREPETRWHSRRVDLRVTAGDCRLLVGRFVLVD